MGVEQGLQLIVRNTFLELSDDMPTLEQHHMSEPHRRRSISDITDTKLPVKVEMSNSGEGVFEIARHRLSSNLDECSSYFSQLPPAPGPPLSSLGYSSTAAAATAAAAAAAAVMNGSLLSDRQRSSPLPTVAEEPCDVPFGNPYVAAMAAAAAAAAAATAPSPANRANYLLPVDSPFGQPKMWMPPVGGHQMPPPAGVPSAPPGLNPTPAPSPVPARGGSPADGKVRLQLFDRLEDCHANVPPPCHMPNAAISAAAVAAAAAAAVAATVPAAFKGTHPAVHLGCEAEMPHDTSSMSTVMLRNIPNAYTREMLLELLDVHGIRGRYDFVYLPVDFRNKVNLGYAFVNLLTHQDALNLTAALHGFGAWRTDSSKVCESSWAHPIQGLREHVERYRNSPVMHPSMPDEYKPVIFRNGERVPFPPPTKAIKAPKKRLTTRDGGVHNS